jgi:hypothetical protein
LVALSGFGMFVLASVGQMRLSEDCPSDECSNLAVFVVILLGLAILAVGVVGIIGVNRGVSLHNIARNVDLLLNQEFIWTR